MFALLFVMWGLGFIAGRKTAPKTTLRSVMNTYYGESPYVHDYWDDDET